MTHNRERIYAAKKMSRNWLRALPTVILALFLLGFPCRSMMQYVQATPAHDCCGDTGDHQAPSRGCQTLCVASAVHILVQSADDFATGVPVDAGLTVLPDADLPCSPSTVVAPSVPVPIASPPLYLQHASFLI